jgi:C4-dicarboxylate transporter DctM subunit
MLGLNFYSGISSFPLLAIPFFVLSGVILQKAGLAAHIARFFELVVRRATGGLAIVAVMTCMFWGALSGSGPATTASVGLRFLRKVPICNRRWAADSVSRHTSLSRTWTPGISKR